MQHPAQDADEFLLDPIKLRQGERSFCELTGPDTLLD
jgi:hypothetical protein